MKCKPFKLTPPLQKKKNRKKNHPKHKTKQKPKKKKSISSETWNSYPGHSPCLPVPGHTCIAIRMKQTHVTSLLFIFDYEV